MKASRESARSFSAVEEAFFRDERTETHGIEPIETFADLDEGYQRPTLWQRLLGKKPR
jgi:hypothetical protein